MGSILSQRRVSGWKTEEDEAPRPISLNLISLCRCLKAVLFHWITPRKAAGPLLPLQNPTPKPSDHPPLKQSLLIYNSDADSECPNIHVFSDHCLEENLKYSSETDNTKDSATISISSFGSHLLDSSIISSITDTDSAVFTQENAPRKNISYAEHEETGTGNQVCEESSDQRLEQNQEYYPKVKDIVDSVTISIPNFSDRAFVYTPSSSTYTDSSAIIQENAPQKNIQSPGICISTVKKSQESSQEKKREKKKVIESTVVVEKPRWIKHYSSSHRILLVGDGDFSFSYSLAAAFGCASKMIATSLDSEEFLKKNYAKAPWNIGELKKRGCIVMHGIDATTIATQLLQHKTFDRIIYNFPFAGFFTGLSRDSTLRRHRRLVSLFLKNAKKMIDEYGEIHISHKTNGYHSEWNLVSIASSHGLRLIDEVEFDLSDYPGYNTKRGFGGDENFNCYPSNTFKFALKLVGPVDMHANVGFKAITKKTYTSNISPPNPIGNEEMVASQEEPISQLTQELECQRPQKLHVRRKRSFKKDACGCSKAAPTGRIKNKLMGSDEVHVQPVEQTVTATPLSMYQQFQECQNLAQMNINAPAPFLGGCLIQSIEKCTTKSRTSKSIIKGEGKKFVSLPSLSSTIAEVKRATCKGKDQVKGKKTEE